MGVSFDISYKMHAIVSVLSLFLLFNLGLAWEETSSAAYIAKTAAEKNAIIAANVIEDTTPGDWYGILEMPGLFTLSELLARLSGKTLEVTATQVFSMVAPSMAGPDSPRPRNHLPQHWTLLLVWDSSS